MRRFFPPMAARYIFKGNVMPKLPALLLFILLAVPALATPCDDTPLRSLTLKDSLIQQIIYDEDIKKSTAEHAQETVAIIIQELKDETLKKDKDLATQLATLGENIATRCAAQGLKNLANFLAKTYSEDEIKIFQQMDTLSKRELQGTLSEDEKNTLLEFNQSELAQKERDLSKQQNLAIYAFIGDMDSAIKARAKALVEAYQPQ